MRQKLQHSTSHSEKVDIPMENSTDNFICGLCSLRVEGLRKMNKDYLVLVSRNNDVHAVAWV